MLNRDLKGLNAEIESYNSKLMELEIKEKDIIKGGANKGAESR